MFMFGKKPAYWKEQFGGIILGFILSVLVFVSSPELSKWKEFIKEIPNIGMCTFGFLLTFLGIILQGGSDTIEWMKSRKDLFPRFIAFNKRIVILSIILSAESALLLCRCYFIILTTLVWKQQLWFLQILRQ